MIQILLFATLVAGILAAPYAPPVYSPPPPAYAPAPYAPAPYAAPSYAAPKAYAPEPAYPPEPYSFGYDINDGYGGTLNQREDGDSYGNKKGSYGYTDPYGIYRQVDYVADEYGFRANIKTNEPGTANQDPASVQLYSSAPPTTYAPAAPYKAPSYAAPSYAPAVPAYPVAVPAYSPPKPVYSPPRPAYSAPVPAYPVKPAYRPAPSYGPAYRAPAYPKAGPY